MQGLSRPATRRTPAWESVPSDLRDLFQQAAARMEPLLTPAAQRAWAAVGRELAQRGGGPPDVALAYLHASPALAAALDSRPFLRWARLGQQLAGESDRAAAAYYHASTSAIASLGPARLGAWAGMGLLLCRARPGSDVIAVRFFDASPRLLRLGPPDALGLVARTLQHADPRAIDLHTDVLEMAARLFSLVQGPDLTAFLRGGERVARANGALLRPYFEAGMSLYARLPADGRGRYRRIVERLLRTSPAGLASFLREGGSSRGLGPLLEAHGMMPLELLGRLAGTSTAAAREFVRNAPTVADKLTTAQMDEWGRLGEAQLASRESAGISFFQLQSRESLDALAALTPAVDLTEVRGLLQLYSQALMGKTVAIVAAEKVTSGGSGMHRSQAEELDWEGAAIFCPSRLNEFPTKEGNFEAYKVLATHQAGHLEFGTVGFRFAADGQALTSVRPLLARLQSKERAYYTEFEQFFDLFADRSFARELFTIAEDTRVDRRVRTEYRGIRQAFGRVQAQALATRPDYRTLPLRQQLVELLVRMSLDAAPVADVPEAVAGTVRQAAGLLNLLASGDATAEDAAEAAVRLYAMLGHVPDLAPDALDGQPRVTLDLAAAQYDPLADDPDAIAAAVLRVNQAFPQRQEDYQPLPPVSYRGEVAPELHQALQKLRQQTRQLAQWQQGENGDGPGSLDDLTDAELFDLVEDFLGISEMFDDFGDTLDGGERVGRFGSREEVLRFLRGQREIGRDLSSQNPHIGEDAVQITLYDEWDYRARTYRPKWCRVRQRQLREGGDAFYDETLAAYRWLVYAVRTQFEMLRPENQGRVKRLQDGEEIDLDAVVDGHAQRHAGHTPSDKIYMRRHKVDRSVAVALLVDLSISTRELIEGDAPRRDSEADGDAGTRAAPKRIIDLERESIVLFIEALEQIGDAYGIYGFSGSGRDDVQFYSIKDLEETFSSRVRRRVDAMRALQGTRMGPAIRHATAKLERAEAKTKVLILLSDGRPQDRDYGALPFDPEALPRSFQGYDDYGLGSVAHQALMLDEKEYALHDTKQALNEARTKGITPFCISVDKLGRDYLREMCGDIGYEVVSEIQSLPRKLPALYRRLTT